MIITISGTPTSGTTTASKQLTQSFEQDPPERYDHENSSTVTHINGGDVFRGMATENNMSLKEFSKHVNDNPDIDEEIDATLSAAVRLFRNTRRDNQDKNPLPIDFNRAADILILESRLAGWIAGNRATVSYWLDAPLEVRKQRVEEAEGEESANDIVDRFVDESTRYTETYGIDIENKRPYDMTINTASWSIDAITETLKTTSLKYIPQADEQHTDELLKTKSDKIRSLATEMY